MALDSTAKFLAATAAMAATAVGGMLLVSAHFPTKNEFSIVLVALELVPLYIVGGAVVGWFARTPASVGWWMLPGAAAAAISVPFMLVAFWVWLIPGWLAGAVSCSLRDTRQHKRAVPQGSTPL